MKYVEMDLTSAIIILFLAFYCQSGWYRIDCALGTQKACGLIAAEYDAKAKALISKISLDFPSPMW